MALFALRKKKKTRVEKTFDIEKFLEVCSTSPYMFG